MAAPEKNRHTNECTERRTFEFKKNSERWVGVCGLHNFIAVNAAVSWHDCT